MSNSINYVLWCVNNSGSAGNVCVYQDPGNVVYIGVNELQTLSWMVQGINSGSQVQFTWAINYSYVWFDYATPLTQGITDATLGTQIALSKNTFGYEFSSPTTGTGGLLTITTNSSIPPSDNSVSGIGMDGAGTFSTINLPNINTTYEPNTDQNLTYWISFGYTGESNEIIQPASMNSPTKIMFPDGVNTVTATYNVDGTWIITNGAPATNDVLEADFVVYTAGIGVI
jgi:hypothetical protein